MDRLRRMVVLPICGFSDEEHARMVETADAAMAHNVRLDKAEEELVASREERFQLMEVKKAAWQAERQARFERQLNSSDPLDQFSAFVQSRMLTLTR